MPYVVKTLETPQHWATQTMSLLTRSRLETELSRKVGRSAMQLQVRYPLPVHFRFGISTWHSLGNVNLGLLLDTSPFTSVALLRCHAL